jgi:flagellar biosynthesis protein FlhF
MLLETFHGNDLRNVFEDARRALGEDVLIVRSAVSRESGHTKVEVIAARQDDLVLLQKRLNPPMPTLPRPQGGRGRSGPFIVALVGPTGGGKTTTAAKLALHRSVFGGRKVGLVTLDTYRVGALEQMQQYAEVTNLPLEVLYDAREIPAAMKRLDDCEVVVVDTPGRSPRAKDANAQWQTLLRAIAPDEVHLVVPATMRPDGVPALVASLAACRLTHACLTKVDELHDERAIADVAARVDLPMRWLTDGQTVPEDLHTARARVLGALGVSVGRSQTARGAAA